MYKYVFKLMPQPANTCKNVILKSIVIDGLGVIALLVSEIFIKINQESNFHR